MLKYVICAGNSKFDRCIEENDFVYYTRETRYDNGQLVDLLEKVKEKKKFEMSNP